MLAGVVVFLVAISFFIRCDLRGLPIENMLTAAVVSLVADGSLVVWSCGHQSSFSSSCSHCVRSSVAVSSFAGLRAVVQTFIWGARRRRCRDGFLVFAGSVATSCQSVDGSYDYQKNKVPRRVREP